MFVLNVYFSSCSEVKKNQVIVLGSDNRSQCLPAFTSTRTSDDDANELETFPIQTLRLQTIHVP